jgi:hypothetical protein
MESDRRLSTPGEPRTLIEFRRMAGKRIVSPRHVFLRPHLVHAILEGVGALFMEYHFDAG